MSTEQSKNGFFHKNTVEIFFNGVKKRVSQEVADSLAGQVSKGAKTTKAKKGAKVEPIEDAEIPDPIVETETAE